MCFHVGLIFAQQLPAQAVGISWDSCLQNQICSLAPSTRSCFPAARVIIGGCGLNQNICLVGTRSEMVPISPVYIVVCVRRKIGGMGWGVACRLLSGGEIEEEEETGVFLWLLLFLRINQPLTSLGHWTFNTCPWCPQIPVFGWHVWNPMRSSAIVAYPTHASVFCACRDAYLQQL